jgi:hypothetical protein
MALEQLSDKQLMNLFTVTNRGDLSIRGRAILIELMRRGIFFDVDHRDFLTRFEWKLRYRGDEPPSGADYELYLQIHARFSLIP